MKMRQNSHNEWVSLWQALRDGGEFSGHFIAGAEGVITQSDLVSGSVLYSRGDELWGRSVLVSTTSQFTTASALIELDGLARRIVVCPPDLPLDRLPYVMETAEVDAIVSDRNLTHFGSRRPLILSPCSRVIAPGICERSRQHETEWILLTSGTTGWPKLVVHTLASLAGAIEPTAASPNRSVWSTFYDVRRYGGLQILLRAVLTRTSLVLAGAGESTSEFLSRVAAHGVTHLSGTPSHWRHALMSPAARLISPEYVRLSGEIADQAILNHLRSFYPEAKIVHAFASTEAGVAFEVKDEMAGFASATLQNTPNVEMKIEEGSLHIRSARTASRYLGTDAPPLKDADGFVDTGDVLEQRDGRYYFAGRRDGIINVGGMKVHPEEIEAVINRHPAVQMSLVRTKKNSITGSIVIADVVLQANPKSTDNDTKTLQNDILSLCREKLSPYKIPVAINIRPELAVAESGKLLRRNA